MIYPRILTQLFLDLKTYSLGPKLTYDDRIIAINENIRKVSHYAAEIAELTINQIYKFENTAKNEIVR